MARGKNTGEAWPRLYLLQIYQQAVEHGFVWVSDLTEERAMSLKMALYRLRRRADSNNAAIIPPEFQLVTAGTWEPLAEPGLPPSGLGRIPFVYSALPDGSALPPITTPEAGELPPMAAPIEPQVLEPIPSPELISAAESAPISDESISSYIEKLRRRAMGEEDE